MIRCTAILTCTYSTARYTKPNTFVHAVVHVSRGRDGQTNIKLYYVTLSSPVLLVRPSSGAAQRPQRA